MFCSLCGAKLEEGYAFCPSCAVRLNKDAKSASGTFVRHNYCPECGAKAIDAYCAACGKATDTAQNLSSIKKYIDGTAERFTVAVEGAKNQIGGVVGDVTDIVKNKKDGNKYLSTIYLVLFLIVCLFVSLSPLGVSGKPLISAWANKYISVYYALNWGLAVGLIFGFYFSGRLIEKDKHAKALDVYGCMALAVLIINSYIFYSVLKAEFEYGIELYNNKVLFALLTVFSLAFILFKGCLLLENAYPDKMDTFLKNLIPPEKWVIIDNRYFDWVSSAAVAVTCLPLFYPWSSPFAFIIRFAIAAIILGFVIFSQSGK